MIARPSENEMRRILILALLIIAAVAGIVWWQETGRPAEAGAQASLLPLLSEEDTSDFTQATEPDAVQFPRDLGPHPDYQTEWWYYTGNLQTDEGRQFGYQLTFFRRALAAEGTGDNSGATRSPGAGDSAPSDWRTNQVYMAHFTVSDIGADEFYTAERFSRGAAGLAGAQATPYRVWLEDWSARRSASGHVQLQARTEDVSLDLTLRETLPPVLHGDGGLSQKGPEPGNASYYYSIVQQVSSGTISVEGQSFDVSGLSWKDHEYSTSALTSGAIGWDWFSLQMENGAALMFFQIRREDGTLQAQSSGTFVYPDGRTRHLSLAEWSLQVTDTWTSPHSGATYPAGWRIEIAALDLSLEGEALMADQELNVSTTYWEGAVQFDGTWRGEPISATGYIEMTGYAGTMEGRI